MNLREMREELACAKARLVAAREVVTVEKIAIARLQAIIRSERSIVKQVKADAKAIKAQQRAAKKAERIAKMEAKLAALKTPAVGVKATKAARKPGPVRTYDGKAAEALVAA